MKEEQIIETKPVKKYGAQMIQKVWFINRDTGKVGSKDVLSSTLEPWKGNKDIFGFTIVMTVKESKQNIDWYFNEDAWLEDIRKL